MAIAHVIIRGVSFGSTIDDPEQVYGITIFNPHSGMTSELYTFRYSRRNKLCIKFFIKVPHKASQILQVSIVRVGLIKNDEVANVIIPLAAFPENNVCHEKLVCTMKNEVKVPMSLVFDMHLDTKNKAAFDAPVGKSKLEIFDSNNYYNLHFNDIREPENNVLRETLLV